MKRDQKIRIGRFEIHRCDRPRDAAMGPMGGGWEWKLGILGGRTSWIVELIYLQFRITRLAR